MVSLPAALEFMLWGATLILGPFLQAFWTGFLHPTLPSEPSSFSETTLFWPRRSVLLVRVHYTSQSNSHQGLNSLVSPSPVFSLKSSYPSKYPSKAFPGSCPWQRLSNLGFVFPLSLSPPPLVLSSLGGHCQFPGIFHCALAWSRREGGGPQLYPRGFPAVYSRCYTHFGGW